MYGVIQLARGFIGQTERPDLLACVGSGFFELSALSVEAIAAAGKERLHEIDCNVLVMSLATVRNCSRMPECEARIRSLAKPLTFCLGARRGTALRQPCLESANLISETIDCVVASHQAA